MTLLDIKLSKERFQSSSTEREKLFTRFAARITPNRELDRKLVSFQGNRDIPFYSWFKYKEGFSAALVTYLLRKFTTRPGLLLEPFAGAGSALFASRELGWNTLGLEVLPVGPFAIKARLAAETIDPDAFAAIVEKTKDIAFADHWNSKYAFAHVQITKGAFSEQTERELAGYLAYCHSKVKDPRIRQLMVFAAFCVLEPVSYTRKDGQYLRWDFRSGRTRGGGNFDKGKIFHFSQAVHAKLQQFASDVANRNVLGTAMRPMGAVDLRIGSCLDLLPTLQAESVDFVLTSPPYCNRYDYTRTYALELAFLGCNRQKISNLRQQMLSCTVENNEKVSLMRAAYAERGNLAAWKLVDKTFTRQGALQEVLEQLDLLKSQNKLNNQNIARMVRNYFYEMCFVVYEMSRIVKSGGKIVIVNDNVRYAGEEVPADLILSDMAEHFGLKVNSIWTLPRGKGNSSQQMGNHGRTELRKCVYVWEKP